MYTRDMDFLQSRISISRGIVMQRVDDCKTTGSAKTFVLAPNLMKRLVAFPTRHWAVLFVFFSPQQTLVELNLTSVVVAVEKWKAFCAFQA